MYCLTLGVLAAMVEEEGEPIEDYQRMIPVVAMVVVLSVLELFFSFFSVFSYTIDSAATGATYQQVKHSTSSSFSCSSYTGCNFLFSTPAAFFLTALSLLCHNFLRCVVLFIIHLRSLTPVKWMWWRLAFQKFHYRPGWCGGGGGWEGGGIFSKVLPCLFVRMLTR